MFDHAVHEGVSEIYVTAFEKHEKLIALFRKYGFRPAASKNTDNGTEVVLLKSLSATSSDLLERYPAIDATASSIYLLSLYPKWHTRLLPDSILRTESQDVVQDISHTNSIHKVYLAAMKGIQSLTRGDVLVIYRTSDQQGAAWYRSVATSLCVVEDYRHIDSFSSLENFIEYCGPFSVFTNSELSEFWKKRRFPHVFRFAYNVALPKRLTRKQLVEDVGMDPSDYWGFMKLNSNQLMKIAQLGQVNENLVIY
jgi:hypothetical protein